MSVKGSFSLAALSLPLALSGYCNTDLATAASVVPLDDDRILVVGRDGRETQRFTDPEEFVHVAGNVNIRTEEQLQAGEPAPSHKQKPPGYQR